ncbi:MAG TPA: glycosyltransferase family 4 protein [Vicinamibacterales bacterium]
MRAPLLAAITLHPTGGGIAVVSNLLWQVLEKHWSGGARLATAFDHDSRPATFSEKLRLGMTVGSAQLLRKTDWILFSHLALAQAQQFVPGPLRRPYGVFLHGIEAWADLSAGEKRAVAAADLRIANSRYTAARVMAKHPDIGHIDACPLALPPVRPSTSGNGPAGSVQTMATGGTVGDHAVLVVGRMSQSERYKGHDQLIDAWPSVVARVTDAQLLIVGEGDDAARLREKAARTACAERIQFRGYVTDQELGTLYTKSALFALPSHGEGFGLVYLEAMTHRLACIGSNQDAASEIIVDGVTGRLVDQRNISGMADAIATLLLDDSRRRAMGEAGYVRATTEFTFDRFSARLCELIERVDQTHRSFRN